MKTILILIIALFATAAVAQTTCTTKCTDNLGGGQTCTTVCR